MVRPLLLMRNPPPLLTLSRAPGAPSFPAPSHPAAACRRPPFPPLSSVPYPRRSPCGWFCTLALSLFPAGDRRNPSCTGPEGLPQKGAIIACSRRWSDGGIGHPCQRTHNDGGGVEVLHPLSVCNKQE